MIKILTWKEEKVFFLDTDAGRVAVKMKTGHWSNNSSLDQHKLVFHNKKQTAVLPAATYREAINDLGLSCGTSVRLISITLSGKLSGADFPSRIVLLFDPRVNAEKDAEYWNQMWAGALTRRICDSTNSVRN